MHAHARAVTPGVDAAPLKHHPGNGEGMRSNVMWKIFVVVVVVIITIIIIIIIIIVIIIIITTTCTHRFCSVFAQTSQPLPAQSSLCSPPRVRCMI